MKTSTTERNHALLAPNFQKNISEIVNAESIISVTDENGIIVHANENFCLISGYTLDELIGQPHRIINSSFHNVDFFKELWSTIKSGKTWKGEIKNKRKDGSFYWVHSTIVPIKNDQEQITHFISIRQDITEKKEAQASLIQASKLSALGEITAKVAHELNNPLCVVMGMSQMVLNKSNLDERATERINKVLRAAQRMEGLIQQMKRHSRNTCDDPKELITLDSIIKNTLILLDATLSSHKVVLSFSVAPDLKPIWGDQVKLESIITNLITNSIDAFEQPHTKQEIKDRKISISIRDDGDFNYLDYQDNAGGIPESIQKHIFDTFFTTKVAGKGTGLGLSMIKTIINEHQGELKFQSEIGAGTLFSFKFPHYKKA